MCAYDLGKASLRNGYLNKIRQLTRPHVYSDNGLKWEKIISVRPPPRIDAIYSVRLTRSRRVTVTRDRIYLSLLIIEQVH